MRFAAIWFAGLGMIVAVVGRGYAQGFSVSDLDSLVEKSETIVESEVGRIANRPTQFGEVTVTRVYKAQGVKEKEGLTVFLGDYRREWKPGDRVFLFLQRATNPQIMALAPAGLTMWEPVRGGVRWETEGLARADKFNTAAQPMRHEREIAAQPTIEDFQTNVNESVKVVAAFHQQVNLAIEKKGPRVLLGLLQGLAERRRGTDLRGRDDALAEMVGQAMAELHDYEVLCAALDTGGTYDPVLNSCGIQGGAGLVAVEKGFWTKEGAEFLLKQIGDAKLDAAMRSRYAHALPSPEAFYGKDLSGVDNAHYIARAAKLEAENSGLEPIGMQLLLKLLVWQRMATGGKLVMGAGMKGDMDETVALLHRIHQDAKAEEVLFGAEAALGLLDLKAYEKLGAKCGPVISTVRESLKVKRTIPGQIHFRLTCVPVFADYDASRMVLTELVFESESDGKLYLTHCMNGGGTLGIESNEDMAVIPKDAPSGKYRMYVRWKVEQKVIGQSHYMDVQW